VNALLGDIWRWAGPRALTSAFVVNGIQLEMNRRAAEKATKGHSKVKKLYSSAQTALAKCKEKTFEKWLHNATLSCLRAFSKFAYYHLHQKPDTSALSFRSNTTCMEKRRRILDLISLCVAEDAEALTPTFVDGKLKLPASRESKDHS